MNLSGTLAPRRPKRSRPKQRANAQLAPQRELGPGLHAKELPLQKALHRSPRQPLCVSSTSSHENLSSPWALVSPLQTSCVTIGYISHWPCTLCYSKTMWTLEVGPPLYQDTLNWPGRSPGFKGKSHLHNFTVHFFMSSVHMFNYVQFYVYMSTDLLMLSCSSDGQLLWAATLLPATSVEHEGAPSQKEIYSFFLKMF